MLAGLSLNLAVLLGPAEGEGEPRLAVVQVPGRLPRLVRPPGVEGLAHVLLEDVIRSELGEPLPGPGDPSTWPPSASLATPSSTSTTRAGGTSCEVIEEELENRRRQRHRAPRGRGRRSPSAARAPRRRGSGWHAEDVYRIRGPLDLRPFLPLVDLPALEDLRDPPLKPQPALDAPGPDALRASSTSATCCCTIPTSPSTRWCAFVEPAADDPDVLAIKQTLYRTSGDSPIVRALARAAENGKQVTVLVELMARFDEQSNIRWARRLEEAGGHVIYGIRGYKTHAKICPRRAPRSRRASGATSTSAPATTTRRRRASTPTSACSPPTAEIGEDASAFFNALTGYSDPPRMKKLVMAPDPPARPRCCA